MKEGWQIKTLNEVCVVERGSSPRPIKSYFTTNPDGVNWIKIGDTEQDGRYVYSTAQKITPEGAKQSRFVKEGDFILTNSMSFGRPYIMKTSGYIHDGWFVFRLKDSLDTDYFYHLLSSPLVQNQFASLASGAIVKNISGDLVKKTKLPIPPLPEQQRIVAILDDAFESIAIAKANAEKNLQNAKALFESYLQGVFSQVGEGWKTKTLGDTSILKIIDGDRGSNYPSKEDFSDDGFCLFLNTKNVRPDGFNFDTTMFVSEEKDKSLRKGKLQRQDVILTTRGTIGNVAIFDESVEFENIRINSGMLIFRVNQKELLPSFLYEVFRSGIMKEQMTRHVSGAAQPQLPIKTLINFEIPIPNSLAAQGKIVDGVRAINHETQRLESIYQQKITALDELKKALLHQAFSGQL